MRSSSRTAIVLLGICLVTTFGSQCLAMIRVGHLDKQRARDKYGITMHARKNGDAGIKVWLEFRQRGWLKDFTYAELRIEDDQGKHLVSARLQPAPVQFQQPHEITTVAFSADPAQLAQCSFLVVCYNSGEGDVGYYLPLKDFLDLANPVADE